MPVSTTVTPLGQRSLAQPPGHFHSEPVVAVKDGKL